MSTITLNVKDFAYSPGGRTRSDGPASGEAYRDTVLIPALRKGELVQVILDGTSGYGSSFLEEAFGGLVRKGVSKQDLKRLKIVAHDDNFQIYKSRILDYIKKASGE